jgi:hypothetical protein
MERNEPMMPPKVQAAKYVPEKSSIFFSAEGTPGREEDLESVAIAVDNVSPALLRA